MNTAQRLIIVDEQNKGGFFSKLIHAFSLNVIVLFRHGFGCHFFSPIPYFLGHWIIFAIISGIHFGATGAFATLALKIIVLGVYLTQLVIAYCDFWFSKTPRHRNDAGISFFSYILPYSEWRIHVVVEPSAAAVLGLVALAVDYRDPTLGILLLLSAGALFIKNFRNYHKFRGDMAGMREPLITMPNWFRRGGVKMPNTGGAYVPPAPKKSPAKGGKSPGVPFLSQPAAGGTNGAKPKRIRQTAPSSFPPAAPPLQAPPPTPPLGAPPASQGFLPNSPDEAEYVRLLGIPPTGLKDLAHLRTLRNAAMNKHHTDKVLDPARKPAADVITQKLNAAYDYFKVRVPRPTTQTP